MSAIASNANRIRIGGTVATRIGPDRWKCVACPMEFTVPVPEHDGWREPSPVENAILVHFVTAHGRTAKE